MVIELVAWEDEFGDNFQDVLDLGSESKQLESLADQIEANPLYQAAAVFAIPAWVKTAAAVISALSSLKDLFSKGEDYSDQLDQITSLLQEIQSVLIDILEILDNLDVAIRREVRRGFEDYLTARIGSILENVIRTIAAHEEDSSYKEEAFRILNEKLDDLRNEWTTIRFYGYGNVNTIRTALMLDTMISKYVARNRSEFKQHLLGYKRYFVEADDVDQEGSVSASMKSARQLEEKLNEYFDNVDSSWINKNLRIGRHEEPAPCSPGEQGNRKAKYHDYMKILGDRDSGFSYTQWKVHQHYIGSCHRRIGIRHNKFAAAESMNGNFDMVEEPANLSWVNKVGFWNSLVERRKHLKMEIETLELTLKSIEEAVFFIDVEVELIENQPPPK